MKYVRLYWYHTNIFESIYVFYVRRMYIGIGMVWYTYFYVHAVGR